MTRKTGTRRFAGFAAMAISLVLFSGCASRAESTSPDDSPSTDGAYPLTMHNAFGDVTIDAKPERVAVLGYADLALASALGTDIVLAPQSFSSVSDESQEKSLPYLDPLPDDTSWFNPMTIDVEQVASTEPDLILATAAFTLDEEVYERLDGIAPVVTFEEGLYDASTESSARRVGQALGENEAADALIGRADKAVSTLKDKLPNLDGGTFLYGQARDGAVVMLVDEKNVTVRFMRELGLVPLPEVADLGGKGSVPGSVDVSTEKADLFNGAGVLFMTFQSGSMKTEFENDPVVSRQPIMTSRYVPVGLEAATALQDPNVVSVPWLLEQLRPGLELVPAG